MILKKAEIVIAQNPGRAPSHELDVLVRCRKNMSRLGEMIDRLSFVLDEVSGALGALNRKPRQTAEAQVFDHAAFAIGAAERSPRD